MIFSGCLMSAPVGFIHSTMTMLMILAGGPLDGEKQICQALNTAIGSIIFFNVPNYQVFHTDNVTVLDLMADDMDPDVYQAQLDIADYFHQKAVESSEIKGKRLPD